MKKPVEQEVKRSVEAWEEKSSDLGFDKDLVWNSIQGNASSKKLYINWYQVAVVIVILFLVGGWGHSAYRNTQLKNAQVVMVGQINTLSSEVKNSANTPKKIQTVEKVRTDTIVKTVTKEVLVKEGLEELERLEQLYQQSLADLSSVKNELQNKDKTLNQLEEELAIMALNLQEYKNAATYPLASTADINLKVDEEALMALSEENKEQGKSSAKPKNKVKLVLFNKSKNSESKALASRGIRL